MSTMFSSSDASLSPAYIETAAGPHSGLSLDAYMQVTSPIRRYFDLVFQRQIRNFLMGAAMVYAKEDLAEIRIFVEPIAKRSYDHKTKSYPLLDPEISQPASG